MKNSHFYETPDPLKFSKKFLVGSKSLDFFKFSDKAPFSSLRNCFRENRINFYEAVVICRLTLENSNFPQTPNLNFKYFENGKRYVKNNLNFKKFKYLNFSKLFKMIKF